MNEQEARGLYRELKGTWRRLLECAAQAYNGHDAQIYVDEAVPYMLRSEKLRAAFHGQFNRAIDDEDSDPVEDDHVLKP